MRTSEQMVREFHEEMEMPLSNEPGDISAERLLLRMKLITEEVGELLCAMTGAKKAHKKLVKQYMKEIVGLLYDSRIGADLVEVADGCCDAHVVISGTAIEYGIPEDEVYREIHRSNMDKKGGPMREDGKQLKPEGWRPPDVRGVLREYGGEEDNG